MVEVVAVDAAAAEEVVSTVEEGEEEALDRQ